MPRSSVRGVRRARSRREAASYVAAFVEQLEDLHLLSASANPLMHMSPSVTNPNPIGYTPAQIAQAYGFNQIAFSGGTVRGDGTGQTIAIVDAYNDVNIAADLQVFDTKFGISAPPKFTTAVERGAMTDAGWALETALDVEWAHAMAPKANILLVEARSSSLADLMTAVDYARNQPGVSVVSMSWGGSEFASETAYDSYLTTPLGHAPITFVAASGDNGTVSSWPAVSPNVLAVGGSSLTLSQGSYASETAWSGSGGGYSTIETEPTYQQTVQTSGHRSFPDVAYDADPNHGFAVYDSTPYVRQSGWFEVGGTSAGAPQWAALVAIADQGRALGGQQSLGNAQSAIYGLPASDFHDIQSGSNGHAASAGYDLVTGRGSPIANLAVQSLVGASTGVAAANVQTPASQIVGQTKTRSVTLPPAEIFIPAIVFYEQPLYGQPPASIIPFSATRSTSVPAPGTLVSSASVMSQAFAPRVHSTYFTSPISAGPTNSVTSSSFSLQGLPSSEISTSFALPSNPLSSKTSASQSVAPRPAASIDHGLDEGGADDWMLDATDGLFTDFGWLPDLTSPVSESSRSAATSSRWAIAAVAGVFSIRSIRRRARRSKKNVAASDSHA